jgi:spermidine/putrescine transport system substrate-binding protein
MKTKTTTTIVSAAAAVALAFTGATHAAEKLNIYCWSEYIPQDVIDDFSKKTGIKVSVENYASNEEMLAKLGAGGGNFDIIQPSEYVVEALVKENLLRPLDKKAIPNLKNIDPKFLNMPFDPDNKYSVPFMAGTVGIVVNTELVKGDIKSFSDVFKPANKGKIVVLDDSREIVSWALLSKGIPVNDVSDKNLEKAKSVLTEWLPLVKVYDSDSPKTALLNGDVAVGIVWGGEGAILLNEDKKFRWIIPAEGTHLFIDSLAIPKTAKNAANAEKFMNYILQPEVSQKISEAFPYLNPNKEAVKLLTEEQRNNAASFPTEQEISKMETFKDIGDRASVIEELVTSLKVE